MHVFPLFTDILITNLGFLNFWARGSPTTNVRFGGIRFHIPPCSAHSKWSRLKKPRLTSKIGPYTFPAP